MSAPGKPVRSSRLAALNFLDHRGEGQDARRHATQDKILRPWNRADLEGNLRLEPELAGDAHDEIANGVAAPREHEALLHRLGESDRLTFARSRQGDQHEVLPKELRAPEMRQIGNVVCERKVDRSARQDVDEHVAPFLHEAEEDLRDPIAHVDDELVSEDQHEHRREAEPYRFAACPVLVRDFLARLLGPTRAATGECGRETSRAREIGNR